MTDTRIIPVIMSGGAGSRLWPLSRQAKPKQLLPLVTEKTMIQETVARFDDPVFTDPVFICNALHVDAIKTQMAEMGQDIGAIIVEPMGRNTAPCAVVAARHALELDENALVLLAPADHHVEKLDSFREAVKTALPAARENKLVTFGITPDRPETGYGYIEQGAPIFDGVYTVNSFREKPDQETAQIYIERRSFSWNAGLFLFSPKAFLDEIDKFVPDIGNAASRAYENATESGVVFELNAETFAKCPSESIDYAVMEHTKKAAIVPVDMGWTDIGSYASLRDRLASGPARNAVKGSVYLQDAKNCLAISDSHDVTLVGLDNIAVIVDDDEIMILNLDKAQDVKQVVSHLKKTDQTDRL